MQTIRPVNDRGQMSLFREISLAQDRPKTSIVPKRIELGRYTYPRGPRMVLIERPLQPVDRLLVITDIGRKIGHIVRIGFLRVVSPFVQKSVYRGLGLRCL